MNLRGTLLCCLLLSLSWAGAGAARAQQPSAETIVESQRRLDQIRRERAELRQEMARIRSRVTDLSSELDNVQRQVRTSAELLDELESQLAQREQQIAQNTLDLEYTRARLAEQEGALHQRLREIYKRGPLQTLQVLLGAESFSDLLNRYRYLLLIARHDRYLADEVASLERQLVARERALRTTLLQLEGAQRERETEFQQLESLRVQQGLALDNVRTREQTAAERLGRLAEDEAQVTSLIATLETRRRETDPAAGGSTAATAASGNAAPNARQPVGLPAASRGTLRWPVEGTILYGFEGNGSAGGRMGVGIGAAAGTTVSSVAGGTVVLAGPFERYGPTVVLSHGGGYYTLYLFLNELRVRLGQVVQASHALGTVGGQTSTEGPHLEFQIRVPGGEAVDPLLWLRAR